MVDDAITPRFTSTMSINDNKWHQITFVYDSGTIYLYVDGILDKSEQNVVLLLQISIVLLLVHYMLTKIRLQIHF